MFLLEETPALTPEWAPLVTVLILLIILLLLFLNMRTHLRKVERLEAQEEAGQASETDHDGTAH